MNKFDWTKWSAIAEIVSSAAILLTLVYLALQTQQLAIQNEQLVIQTGQNTAAIQATVRQAMLSEDRETLYKIIDYPFLSLRNRCNLTEEQALQTQSYLLAFLRARENHWLQYQAGVLDRATWEAYRVPLSSIVLESEIGRTVWEVAGRAFEPGFAAIVDEMIASTPIVECE